MSTTSSPLMMSPSRTVFLVVDLQERLVPVMAEPQRVVHNARRLVDAAKVFGVRTVVTEQYPKGLGHTVELLAVALADAPRFEKVSFSCLGTPEITASLADCDAVLLCGIETHVCVAQTAFDLLAQCYRVFLAVDAVGSRHETDHETALRRMEASGVTLTTTEAVFFEWCRSASHPAFKAISALAKEV
ncbi:MAG: hydrolase [Thermoguttaceae bacterium]